MKTKYFTLTVYIFTVTLTANAQKSLPIQVNSILAKISIPQSSEANFHGSTTETDLTTGVVSVKDAGPAMNEIQSTLGKDMTDLTNGMMSSASNTSAPSMPSQEQIAEMKQQAEQMRGMTSQQAQQMMHTGTSQPMDNPSLMQELGKAQSAMMQINMLINELSAKASKLGGENQQNIDEVPKSSPCPDVKIPGADIAVPTCECMKARSLEHYNKVVAVENGYIRQIDELLLSYFPKIKTQIAIIDDAEKDLKYGDSVNNPVFKNQVVMVQQQALGALSPIVGLVSNVLKDSATEYANIVNTNNGTLIGCHK